MAGRDKVAADALAGVGAVGELEAGPGGILIHRNAIDTRVTPALQKLIHLLLRQGRLAQRDGAGAANAPEGRDEQQ